MSPSCSNGRCTGRRDGEGASHNNTWWATSPGAASDGKMCCSRKLGAAGLNSRRENTLKWQTKYSKHSEAVAGVREVSQTWCVGLKCSKKPKPASEITGWAVAAGITQTAGKGSLWKQEGLGGPCFP